jgi:murein DD-endopeptidase MepM/ murein hydrolase activator NlpD
MLINAPIRGNDKYGSGAYDAPRGSHNHRGADPACYPGSGVNSVSDGVVTKIGFPYSQDDPDLRLSTKEKEKFLNKKALRYVQITYGGLDFRYMYIIPSVKVGDKIQKGVPIGTSISLQHIYPGITEHFHFEIKENGKHINPGNYL